jgi:ATP-dependent protease ClpP protease subunit
MTAFSQTQEDINELMNLLDNQQKSNIELNKDKEEIYHVYIDDDIVGPAQYREVFELLDKVKEKDTVIFRINTNGGSAQTTVALINSIKNCKAMTVAEIQTAYSAGGIIAMACKKKTVMPYATMMIHSIQLGATGDINKIQKELSCFKKLSDSIIRDSFKDFLTKEELEYVLNGGTVWLNEEEIKNKLKK